MIIRNEEAGDFRAVEELTKLAFWNVSTPGCSEHYLAHVLRLHADFIPEMDFVVEEDGRIIGNIMYTRSRLIDAEGREKTVLTFGPLSIHPEYQRKGYGKKLQLYSFERAKQLGYDTIVIFGNPENYVGTGFRSCKHFHVSLDGIYPVALLVKELEEGALQGRSWNYVESPAYEIDAAEAEAFDRDFAPMEKAYRPSQELFYIYSRSAVVR